MDKHEVHGFHLTRDGAPQFKLLQPFLLRSGGMFAAQLAQQVLTELVQSGFNFQGLIKKP